jgi:pyruvate-formate lyase-activating enzyme
MSENVWKVVPICDYQKLDVRQDDLLNGGDFRKCETYRGGGGYDQFPTICEKRKGRRLHKQFIAQLYGCNLDCPYCYVTRSGVWGAWKPYTTTELCNAYIESKQEVFHLMGGAPALYLPHWAELFSRLPASVMFHSDFLLTEQRYSVVHLDNLRHYRDYALYAVDVKGTTPADYEKNTRKPFKEELFWKNWENIIKAELDFYVTFTAPDMNHYDEFCEKVVSRLGSKALEDCFTIPLIDYDATPYVDIRPAPVAAAQ